VGQPGAPPSLGDPDLTQPLQLYAFSQSVSFWVISLVFYYGSRQLVDGSVTATNFFIALQVRHRRMSDSWALTLPHRPSRSHP
jgi:hypothetical protein